MPVEEVRAILATPDPAARSELIAAHLGQLEQRLKETSAASGLIAGPAGARRRADHRGLSGHEASARSRHLGADPTEERHHVDERRFRRDEEGEATRTPSPWRTEIGWPIFQAAKQER